MIPRIFELTSSGNTNPAVTPGAAVVSTRFDIKGVPVKTRKLWNVALSLIVLLRVGLDQAASGGAAINRDKLYKLFDGFSLWAPLLGHLYPLSSTRGAVAGLIYQVIGNGYDFPQPFAAQIAAADGDTACDIYVRLPLALDVLANPLDTAPLMLLLEGGYLDVRFAANDALGGDSTGLVSEATTNLRAWIEYTPVVHPHCHGPFGFREYESAGSGTKFKLAGFGKAGDLKGIEDGCSLGFLAMLTDATGMGLSGSDGTDNVTRVEIPDLDQQSVEVPDAFVHAFLRSIGKAGSMRMANTATSNPGGWPYTIAATVANRLNDAQALFLPLFWSALGQRLSRLPQFHKPADIGVNYGFTSTPSGTMRHVTLEFYRYGQAFRNDLRRQLGLPESYETLPAASNGIAPNAQALGQLKFGARQVFVEMGG